MSGRKFYTPIDMTTDNKIVNVKDPTASQDAATMAYVNAQDNLLKVGRIEIGVDGGIWLPVVGVLTDFVVPFNLQITGWEVLADVSGSIQVDIWKVAYSAYPATVANAVTGSDKPCLSAAQKATSSALTGWTTAWSAGDCVRVNLDSVTTIKRATVILTYTRT